MTEAAMVGAFALALAAVRVGEKALTVGWDAYRARNGHEPRDAAVAELKQMNEKLGRLVGVQRETRDVVVNTAKEVGELGKDIAVIKDRGERGG